MTVERPDLSARTALSKSMLGQFDVCPKKVWHARWNPRPFIRNPKVTFGSCVDAGVEVLIACARAGIPLDMYRARAASWAVQDRAGIEVDQDEATSALEGFAADIIPAHDWALCRTQAAIHLPLFDWGEVDGHPDIVFGTNLVADVKTSARAKTSARSLELGFYALLVEAETGNPVPEVGYFTWVRVKRPYWQPLFAYVDDEFRRWTRARVDDFMAAWRLDEQLNAIRLAHEREPRPDAFPGFPMNASVCRDCQFNPIFGGACRLAPATTEEAESA